MNPLRILFQDDDLVVVDKPAGLASVPSPGVRGRTCLALLHEHVPGALAVHRLDRETSGLLVFARHARALEAMKRQFRGREVKKTYLALAAGLIRRPHGSIRHPIADLGPRAEIRADGRPALTHYAVRERLARATLVEVSPVTGRYNQVRIHFAAIGHPLVGERKYARGKDSPVRFRRVALHAARLQFQHPLRGKALSLKAALPADLKELIGQLRG